MLCLYHPARRNLRALLDGVFGALRSDEAPATRPNWSYIILVEELRRIVGEPKKDAKELVRRVCFNALISNIDDHPRNHAIIAKNILSEHTRFLLDKGEAGKIVSDIKQQVEGTWYETLRACGVSERDAETIRGAFLYPRFFL